ncbi:hypothetical protein TNCV_2567901 [Trichonephila clavipes]|uniref:Uncharacterized protein n=1 Tax=Trichonephila clavipes TaxID=2585209 RepID=A0A8X7BMR9_TRICX|nr:hypothetical protein TNCV_2567901 [Trichonephila clavipes]
MLDTSPFRSRDKMCRLIAQTHQWSGTTVRGEGCKCVHHPMRSDEGRESDPPLEFIGVDLEVERDFSISIKWTEFLFPYLEFAGATASQGPRDEPSISCLIPKNCALKF